MSLLTTTAEAPRKQPMTLTGRLLAAFLRGLFPNTNQFARQIADIERQAADAAYPAAFSALKGLALKYASHRGSCCTFDAAGRVVVTRESCLCLPPERAAQEALGMFGIPAEYTAALTTPTPAPVPQEAMS